MRKTKKSNKRRKKCRMCNGTVIRNNKNGWRQQNKKNTSIYKLSCTNIKYQCCISVFPSTIRHKAYNNILNIIISNARVICDCKQKYVFERQFLETRSRLLYVHVFPPRFRIELNIFA